MEELERILRQHAARYPAMEPTDAVKLIFQNEFGGGHLVLDQQSCLAFLQQEYETVRQSDEGSCAEPIGNGLYRVMLSHLDSVGYSIDPLGQEFIRSAEEHRGDRESFLEKLELLKRLTKEGAFAFSISQLDAYLADYMKKGCPAVSHSPAYRRLYHPAYRIVLEKYLPSTMK